MPFHLPRVYPILDTETVAARGASCADVARALIAGGAGILQYRHKSWWRDQQLEEAREIARQCLSAGILFVVNDRADYCAILRKEGFAAGLHVGQEDLTPADARAVVGPDAPVGFSTHNRSQMIAAKALPTDYLAFGPVFGTATKQNPDPTTGLTGLQEARALTASPLVAIGGITLQNASECWQAGADSVAVISGLLPEPFSLDAVSERMRCWQRLASL